MQFLVDECLPFDIQHTLSSAGFDAIHVLRTDLKSASDDRIWETRRARGPHHCHSGSRLSIADSAKTARPHCLEVSEHLQPSGDSRSVPTLC